jgi:hypothetical protein
VFQKRSFKKGQKKKNEKPKRSAPQKKIFKAKYFINKMLDLFSKLAFQDPTGALFSLSFGSTELKIWLQHNRLLFSTTEEMQLALAAEAGKVASGRKKRKTAGANNAVSVQAGAQQWPRSHLLLNGGVCSVSTDQDPVFVDYYIKALRQGAHCFISEQRTRVFKLMVDWDLQLREPIALPGAGNVFSMTTETTMMDDRKNPRSETIRNRPEIADADSTLSALAAIEKLLLPFLSIFLSVLTAMYCELPPDQLQKALQMVVCVSGYARFPPTTPTATVVTATTAGSSGAGKTSRKLGVHIYFPELYVTDELARMIREMFLHRLYHSAAPPSFSSVSASAAPSVPTALLTAAHPTTADSLLSVFSEHFAQMYDERVYRSNGLRMPGSFKVRPCETCHNHDKKRAKCRDCFALGVLLHPQIYLPCFVYTPVSSSSSSLSSSMQSSSSPSSFLCEWRWERDAAEELKYEQDLAHWVKKLSCRSALPSPQPDFIEPDEAMRAAASAFSAGASNAYKSSQRGSSSGGVGEKRAWQDRTLLLSDEPEVQLINDILASWPSYSECTASKVFRTVYSLDDIVYTVHIKGPAEQRQFCHNVGREHQSSSVYFVIRNRTNGIQQRCFSRKPHPQTVSGLPCERYWSEPTQLPAEDIRLLFELPSTFADNSNKQLVSSSSSQHLFAAAGSSSLSGPPSPAPSSCFSASSSGSSPSFPVAAAAAAPPQSLPGSSTGSNNISISASTTSSSSSLTTLPPSPKLAASSREMVRILNEFCVSELRPQSRAEIEQQRFNRQQALAAAAAEAPPKRRRKATPNNNSNSAAPHPPAAPPPAAAHRSATQLT